MSKVGFTGTRNGMTRLQKFSLGKLLIELKPDEVHHGDCVGSDKTFHKFSEALDLRIVIHPPDDDKLRAYCLSQTILPMKSYLERNRDIVQACEIVIGTPKQSSDPGQGNGGGTWYTLNYAAATKKTVYIIKPDGKVSVFTAPTELPVEPQTESAQRPDETPKSQSGQQ